jgi:hypothetical protein
MPSAYSRVPHFEEAICSALSKNVKLLLSFIVRQNTTIINNSSTLHVQMGLLEVKLYHNKPICTWDVDEFLIIVVF